MTRSRGQAPIRFHVLTAAQLSATDLQFAFELLKSNMRELYADEWSDVEKRKELTHSDARYLIGSIDDEAVAYLCFRFTLEEKVYTPLSLSGCLDSTCEPLGPAPERQRVSRYQTVMPRISQWILMGSRCPCCTSTSYNCSTASTVKESAGWRCMPRIRPSYRRRPSRECLREERTGTACRWMMAIIERIGREHNMMGVRPRHVIINR